MKSKRPHEKPSGLGNNVESHLIERLTMLFTLTRKQATELQTFLTNNKLGEFDVAKSGGSAYFVANSGTHILKMFISGCRKGVDKNAVDNSYTMYGGDDFYDTYQTLILQTFLDSNKKYLIVSGFSVVKFQNKSPGANLIVASSEYIDIAEQEAARPHHRAGGFYYPLEESHRLYVAKKYLDKYINEEIAVLVAQVRDDSNDYSKIDFDGGEYLEVILDDHRSFVHNESLFGSKKTSAVDIKALRDICHAHEVSKDKRVLKRIDQLLGKLAITHSGCLQSGMHSGFGTTAFTLLPGTFTVVDEK